MNSLGSRVRDLRNRQHLSLAELARTLGCSAPKIYKLENHKTKRPVPSYFVKQLCDALAQNDSEIAELFELAGYKAPARNDVQRIVRAVEDTLHVPELNQFSEELVAEVEAFIVRWRNMRQVRRQRVGKVVVVAAGWQPRLLSINRFERTLFPAVDEAARAGIFEIILVVAPNTPKLDAIEQTFSASTIRYVVQREALGIGNAILAAQDHVEHEPFALVLADEIDESRIALCDMVKAYADTLTPLVAVDTYEPEDQDAVLRYYGFAALGDSLRHSIFRIEADLVEKPSVRPSSNYLRIAGRYILTPEIVFALQNPQYFDKGPVRHDLTAALNQLRRASASVLAYKLPRPMLSIAPYRDIIQKMDQRKVFDAASY